MPVKDGRYAVSFDVPEFYMEVVDFSFDYIKCKKEKTNVFGLGVLELPYPKCSKERKVIKFEVPRVRMKRVEIETPYGSEEEFDEMLKKGINSLIDHKSETEKEREELSKDFDSKIEEAKKDGADKNELKRLELMKQLELLTYDETLVLIAEQIKRLESGKIQ